MADHLSQARPLNVAMLAPLVSPIRQPYLGGAQALVRDLSVGLAAHGHRITLYAAQGSDPGLLPGVTLVPVAVDPERVIPTDFSASAPDRARVPIDPAVEDAFAQAFNLIAANARHHDLLHAHAYDAPAFRGAQALSLPVAHTLHLPALDPEINSILGALAPARQPRAAGQPWLATVSHACADTYACRIDAIIYNGLDVAAIPFGAAPAREGYLLYAGRITPEKGVEDAIEMALLAGQRLTLVGGVYDQEYDRARIQPLLAAHPDQLTALGSQRRERVWELMAGATAVLTPSYWDEPFGLVACEAQAAGTPVVGYDSGGLREVIAQGVTGMLVPRGDIAGAAEAIATVAHYSRRACRQRAETLFSLESAVAAYETFYRQMLIRR